MNDIERGSSITTDVDAWLNYIEYRLPPQIYTECNNMSKWLVSNDRYKLYDYYMTAPTALLNGVVIIAKSILFNDITQIEYFIQNNKIIPYMLIQHIDGFKLRYGTLE